MTDTTRALRPSSRSSTLATAFACLAAIVAVAICGDRISAFFSIGGLVIVVGGVIAVAFMSFHARDVRAALRAITCVPRLPASDGLPHDMEQIIRWAHVARESGLRQLESVVAKDAVRDPFIRYGINMVLSEYAPEDVRRMMETAAEGALERASEPADVLHAMTSHAPAFGMVGTLIGMVAMLFDLGAEVSSIGPTLAVSFLSTLYGVVSARMIYMPAASRLQHEIDRERFRHGLFTEGMVMLAEKRAPTFIRDRLNGFLAPEAHDYLDTVVGAVETMRPARPASAGRLAAFGGTGVGLGGLKAINL